MILKILNDTMPTNTTTATSNASNNSSQVDLATPRRGSSSSNSSITKDTTTSGTKLQRFKESWAYDPFNQPDSIQRYEAWRAESRQKRKVKLQKLVHETAYKAKSAVGLGSKRRLEQDHVVTAQ